MAKTFAVEALAQAGILQHAHAGVLKHPSADALLAEGAGPGLQNHGMNAVKVKKVREHQTRRSAPKFRPGLQIVPLPSWFLGLVA